MKINHKNTALELMDNPKDWNFAFPPNMYSSEDKWKDAELKSFGRSILRQGETLKYMCGKNIQYVSESFWMAYLKGKHKLKEIFNKEPIEEAGTLILGSGKDGKFTHTYYYYIKTFGTGDDWDYSIMFMDFSKHSKNIEHYLDVYISRDCTATDKKNISVIWKQHLDDGLDNQHWEAFIISFVLFKKYCDIETKVIDPNKNRKAVVAGQKYLNETDKRITILDSTWFTNLVVSGAFDVEGHLHWYYYGPNRSMKKLQWVNTYQKSGYVRKAKAITEQLNENQKTI